MRLPCRLSIKSLLFSPSLHIHLKYQSNQPLPQSLITATEQSNHILSKPFITAIMPFIPAPCSPPNTKDVYAYEVLSDQAWEPIFDIRSRTPWVQIVAFDLFKQLTPMRFMSCSLPTIDTLMVPLERQARVEYGDLLGLCDTIVSPLPYSLEATAAKGLTPMKSGICFPFVRSSRGCIRGPRRQRYAVDQILPGMPAAKS